MAAGFRVTQAEADFDKLAAKLRRAEKSRVRRALTQGLRDIAKPVGEAMLRSGAEAMPNRGGLSARVARSSVRQTNKLGSNPRVTITLRTRQGDDLEAMNRGQLRHPTFGHGPWVVQPVRAGAFTDGFNEAAPLVRDALRVEVERVIQEIGS